MNDVFLITNIIALAIITVLLLKNRFEEIKTKKIKIEEKENKIKKANKIINETNEMIHYKGYYLINTKDYNIIEELESQINMTDCENKLLVMVLEKDNYIKLFEKK